ncbi:M1 family metallopeptidase [Rhodohalobacter sp. 614A]|uniref:M1 family metallopeptidase n=1 Tax=Rhodohalobacter sp. 614A TaxID=2908649 RepID=UPI001F4521F2|nr:M1 family metallopeptidase [Rhodohalobacter sp. 614A]
MFSRISLLFAFIVLLTKPAISQELIYDSGGDLTPELSAYNVHFYDLNLTVNPADSTVSGFVDVHFDVVQPSNRIALALDPQLDITSVEQVQTDSLLSELNISRSDASQTFHVNYPATLQPGSSEKLRISYKGKPRVAPNPPWDGGMVWDTTSTGEPWVAVTVQSDGAWIWWPNKDHPSDKADSVAINLTMPDDLVVASNGRLRGETVPEDGWKTWNWFVSTPINNYNITVNAAPYEIIEETYTSTSGDEFPVKFWVLPENLEDGKELFPQFINQLRFLEELLGPYPFRADKYGVVHSPHLGMEHQTLIAYGAGFRDGALSNGEAQFDDLHQHELAHEWWGNLVTAWNWRDFWIHEGIGTYMQPLYSEHLGGEEAYKKSMEYIRMRMATDPSMEVAPRKSMSTLQITQGTRGGDVYFKGAWFLHTLRYVIGDNHFFTLLRRFAYPTEEMESVTDGSQVRFATTDDFLNLAEKISGQDLDWLFEIYLRQPKLPVLHASRQGVLVTLRWEVPEGLKFPMPIEVQINGEVVMMSPENNRIAFEVGETVQVEADPDNWILKEFDLAGSEADAENE